MTDENPLEIEETSEEGNVLGPNDEIEVDGRIYTLSDIMQAKEQLESMSSEVESLRAFKESTNQLMSDNLGWDQKMQAARVVLSESGYTPEQIETYIQDYQGVMEEEDNTFEETEEDEPVMQYEPEEIQDDPRIDEARSMARQSSAELKAYRLQMLQREMDRGIKNAIDTNGDISVLLGRLPENQEGQDNAKARLQQQVHDQTLRYLQERKAREGTFSEAWVDEAAERATNEVVGTYRTVIGDLDSIGRSPETVSGEPTLSSTPPVPEPEYKEGMNRGVVDKSVNDWTTDALSRLADETSAGEESKAQLEN